MLFADLPNLLKTLTFLRLPILLLQPPAFPDLFGVRVAPPLGAVPHHTRAGFNSRTMLSRIG
jgi:hypothetical protein